MAHPTVAQDLHRILDGRVPAGVEIAWAEGSEGGGQGLLLAEVQRALNAGPVLLHPGDSLFGDQMPAMAARFDAGDVDAVLPAQATVSTPRVPGTRVSDTAILLGPATSSLLEGLSSLAAEDAGLIETLLQSDRRLAVCAVTQHWTYGDTTAELLAANRMLLDSMPATRAADQSDRANEIHGRVSIDPSASVSGSVIHGPVAIDGGAVVEDSFVGPYTAIGAGAVLRGAELDNTMVMRGAEISHPDSRIEGSIIGERCRVTRSFALPRALHLHLAQGSCLTIS